MSLKIYKKIKNKNFRLTLHLRLDDKFCYEILLKVIYKDIVQELKDVLSIIPILKKIRKIII